MERVRTYEPIRKDEVCGKVSGQDRFDSIGSAGKCSRRIEVNLEPELENSWQLGKRCFDSSVPRLHSERGGPMNV